MSHATSSMCANCGVTTRRGRFCSRCDVRPSAPRPTLAEMIEAMVSHGDKLDIISVGETYKVRRASNQRLEGRGPTVTEAVRALYEAHEKGKVRCFHEVDPDTTARCCKHCGAAMSLEAKGTADD